MRNGYWDSPAPQFEIVINGVVYKPCPVCASGSAM